MPIEYKIYCINCIGSIQKYEQSKKIFDDLGLEVEYLKVERDVQNPTRGCFNSHMTLIRKIVTQNLQYALIFEDDIYPVQDKQTVLRNINKCINYINTLNIDILFMGGGNILFTNTKINKELLTGFIACTHSYIMSSKCANKLSSFEYNGIDIDQLYAKIGLNSLLFLPSIFNQTFKNSDIEKSDFYGRFRHYSFKLLDSISKKTFSINLCMIKRIYN